MLRSVQEEQDWRELLAVLNDIKREATAQTKLLERIAHPLIAVDQPRQPKPAPR